MRLCVHPRACARGRLFDRANACARLRARVRLDPRGRLQGKTRGAMGESRRLRLAGSPALVVTVGGGAKFPPIRVNDSKRRHGGGGAWVDRCVRVLACACARACACVRVCVRLQACVPGHGKVGTEAVGEGKRRRKGWDVFDLGPMPARRGGARGASAERLYDGVVCAPPSAGGLHSRCRSAAGVENWSE